MRRRQTSQLDAPSVLEVVGFARVFARVGKQRFLYAQSALVNSSSFVIHYGRAIAVPRVCSRREGARMKRSFKDIAQKVGVDERAALEDERRRRRV